MKHLIILYATYNNGTADKKAIYEANSQAEAVATFHSYMGTYMKDATVSMVTVWVATTNGSIIKSENYIRVPEVEIEEASLVTE